MNGVKKAAAEKLQSADLNQRINRVPFGVHAPGGLLDLGSGGLLDLLGLVLSQHVLVVLAVGLQQLVPPGKGGGVVPHEVHVVEVMEARASVEGNQVERVHRDIVTAERERCGLILL